MKTIFIIMSVAVTILTSCGVTGQEDVNTRYFEISGFSKINLEGGFRVFLYQTSDPYLKVKAPTDAHIDALVVDTGNDNLKLYVRRNHLNLSRMELHIGFSNLEEIGISGGVKLTTDGYVELDDLRIINDGAVNGDIKIKAATIEVVSNGASLFEISGIADKLSVRVAGAAHVNARELTAKEVVFRVEGLGFGSVHATDELDVRIEGAGKVTYKGNPNVRRVVEGLGSVNEY